MVQKRDIKVLSRREDINGKSIKNVEHRGKKNCPMLIVGRECSGNERFSAAR